NRATRSFGLSLEPPRTSPALPCAISTLPCLMVCACTSILPRSTTRAIAGLSPAGGVAEERRASSVTATFSYLRPHNLGGTLLREPSKQPRQQVWSSTSPRRRRAMSQIVRRIACGFCPAAAEQRFCSSESLPFTGCDGEDRRRSA